MKGWWPFILLFFALDAHAQVGNCETSLAEAYLNAGNVRARILTTGSLFWRGSPHVYEVPKGGGSNAIFSAAIWVGGLINDSLHVAASRYGPWEFWPGPLDEAGNPPDDCSLYDNIWEIRTEDIQAFLDGGGISTNLENWPWQLGAPVLDGDGNPDNYNLDGGDLPALLGDQRLWWIMNDRGNAHRSTDSEPLGIEVHASAFAFDHPSTLGNLTFYEYQVINKNTAPVKDTYFTLFADVEIGNWADDYIGSDSLLHLGFAYNADNNDQYNNGYGIAPPAIGFTFLETISADEDGLDNNRNGSIDEPDEKLGTTSVMAWHKGAGVAGNPRNASEYYNNMQALWNDGRPLIEGRRGRDGVPPYKKTRFFLPGDPLSGTFWSEINWDNEGNSHEPYDRKLISTTGPFVMRPGDTTTVRFAIIWSRGEDHLDSIRVLRKDTRAVRSTAEELYSALTRDDFTIEQPPPANHVLGFDQNFPNPFSQSTTFRYSLPQPMQVRLAVYDMLGREVALLVDAQQEAGIYTTEFDAGNLPAGVYLARIELDFLQFTKRMVLLR
ncbi:MAG: T9SS type A sorting domain-containing protein [Bacteroidota bacterium]